MSANDILITDYTIPYLGGGGGLGRLKWNFPHHNCESMDTITDILPKCIQA